MVGVELVDMVAREGVLEKGDVNSGQKCEALPCISSRASYSTFLFLSDLISKMGRIIVAQGIRLALKHGEKWLVYQKYPVNYQQNRNKGTYWSSELGSMGLHK